MSKSTYFYEKATILLNDLRNIINVEERVEEIVALLVASIAVCLYKEDVVKACTSKEELLELFNNEECKRMFGDYIDLVRNFQVTNNSSFIFLITNLLELREKTFCILIEIKLLRYSAHRNNLNLYSFLAKLYKMIPESEIDRAIAESAFMIPIDVIFHACCNLFFVINYDKFIREHYKQDYLDFNKDKYLLAIT